MKVPRYQKKLDLAKEATKFRVLEAPRLPRVPIKPDKNRIILIGLMVGLCFGVGIVFLKESLNTAYKTIDAIKNDIDLPVIGRIATIDNLDVKEKKIANELRKNKKRFQSA